MKFKNCNLDNFINLINNKKIICFGASKYFQSSYEKYGEWFSKWKNNISYFIDNNEKKWNTDYCIGDKEYKIYNPKKILGENNYVILITTNANNALEIANELEQLEYKDKIEDVYILPVILKTKICDDSAVQKYIEETHPIVNKKIIHTFWFSNDPIPYQYQRCIDSWKKFCPDYKIIIWNSSTYDVNKNKFMKQAFDAKKWAFVSDYARLDVIYQYGGIYLDMDVEVLRSLDSLLQVNSFFGIDEHDCIDLGTGFGSVEGNPFIKELLGCYEKESFINEDGTMNLVPQPTKLLYKFQEYGYVRKQASQKVNDTIFLSLNYFDVYCGKTILQNRKSGKEFLIHWHNAGWWDEEQRNKRYESVCKALELLEQKFSF